MSETTNKMIRDIRIMWTTVGKMEWKINQKDDEKVCHNSIAYTHASQ